MFRISSSTSCLLFAATIFCVPPALAQRAPPEEITVTGRVGRVPDSVRLLSTVVSYRDLDLSTAAGKKVLRDRVNNAARYLCDLLGESGPSTPPAPSCQDAAVRDALVRVNKVEAHFAPRGTTWVRGPAYVPVYPKSWMKTHPNRP